MSEKIESLSELEISRLPEYRDKWLSIGLSTEAGNKGRAQELAIQAYHKAGVAPPNAFLWLQSPYVGAVAAAIIAALDAKPEDIPITAVFMPIIVADDSFEAVFDQAQEKIAEWADTFGKGKQVREMRASDIKSEASSQLSKCGYGLHDASWLSFYDFFLIEKKLECCERLRPLINLARDSGWWWPFEGVAVMTEKPCDLHRDNEHRLHKYGDAAIKYNDSWGVYAINGTRIPREWGVTPENDWKPEWLLEEHNAELKRLLFQTIGYDRIMYKLDSKFIHKDGDMELREIRDVDVEPVRLLKVRDSTTRSTYALRVPPNINKCEPARQWTFHRKMDFIKET